jgi:DNA-binding response OmpR family regulator
MEMGLRNYNTTANLTVLPSGVADAQPQARRFRVLVAESRWDVARLINRFLTRLDCATDVVVNAAAAVGACRLKWYDLALLDLEMARSQGFYAAFRMRAQGFQQPIVAITSRRGEVRLGGRPPMGFDDYLLKPFGIDRLRTIIQGIKREMTTLDPFSTSADSSSPDPAAMSIPSGAASDLVELLTYLSRLPETCWTLQEAQQQRKGYIIAAFAHQIVGMADLHELGPLKGVAARLGQAAHSGDWNRVQICLDSLKEIAQIYLDSMSRRPPK